MTDFHRWWGTYSRQSLQGSPTQLERASAKAAWNAAIDAAVKTINPESICSVVGDRIKELRFELTQPGDSGPGGD